MSDSSHIICIITITIAVTVTIIIGGHESMGTTFVQQQYEMQFWLYLKIWSAWLAWRCSVRHLSKMA